MVEVNSGSGSDVEMQAALASGRADPAIALMLHAAAEMRGDLDRAPEVIAGAALEAEAITPLAPNALEQVFARINGDASPGSPGAPDDARRELIRIPARLRMSIEAAEAANGWKSSAGLQTLDLALGGECKAEIMRIPAGKAVPRHTHRGNELTLCLSGGFSDGIGSYGPGDVSVTDPSITHRPIADPEGPCYVFAVTDDGLKFTGALGLLQRLFGR